MNTSTLYTGKVHVTGGRDGSARSDDGRLDIRLTSPGARGDGTNPEQLLAAGWSACFQGAMAKAARQQQVALPAETAIDAEIDLRLADGAYSLAARLAITLPGLPRDTAQAIVEMAHRTCPYSKALTGNIEIELRLV